MLKTVSFLIVFLVVNAIIASDNNFNMKITVTSSVQDTWNPGTEIGIDDNTTVLDIKKLLETSERIFVDEQFFCPLVRKWGNFKIFPIQGPPLMNNNELITNVIKRYKTTTFYLYERKKQ